jgi:SM-20-related protein
MSRAAQTLTEAAGAPHPALDIEALERAPVQTEPFAYLIVPGFVRAEALAAIRRDFPEIEHAGSFPLTSLRYGPAFADLIDELRRPQMIAIVARKLGMDLASAPTMVTVRGQSRAQDGKIHTDSRTKLVTALIYMNDSWESPRGRLRLVRSEHDLDDVIAEVPPEQGTLLLFKNEPNAWHGFEPFSGPRRVIQLNWVTSTAVVRREQFRHRISALFKRLKRPA